MVLTLKTTPRSTTINDLTNSHLVRGNGVSKSILRREREHHEKRGNLLGRQLGGACWQQTRAKRKWRGAGKAFFCPDTYFTINHKLRSIIEEKCI